LLAFQWEFRRQLQRILKIFGESNVPGVGNLPYVDCVRAKKQQSDDPFVKAAYTITAETKKKFIRLPIF
jgi:hypothetical protein